MHRRWFITLVFATAWLGVAQPGKAQGTIAYYQPPSPIILRDEFFAQFYPLDLDGDGHVDLTFAYDFHFVGVRCEQATRILTNIDPPPNIGGSVAPLASGFSIGQESAAGWLQWLGTIPGAPYETDFNTLIQCFDVGCTGDFRGQQAYMGVEFQRASGTHYGWVSLYVSPFATPVAVIDSWAWETRPGVPILAGAVPEPSAWALLVGGGVLIVWFRRKRNEGMG
jgi:hypothetical protein